MIQEERKKLNGPPPLEVHYPEQINTYYSNRAQFFISNSDVVIDFALMEPTSKTPKAIFQTRIIMSPQHAKQFINLLSENIRKYEGVFGPISVTPVKK